MSNYPPGVSGNEWQIVGPDTINVSRDCEATEAAVTPAVPLGEELWRLATNLHKALRQGPVDSEVARYVREAASDLFTLRMSVLKDAFEAPLPTPCPGTYEGPVELYDHSYEWACPKCGKEHSEVYDPREEEQ